jgi:hypothetical protein
MVWPFLPCCLKSIPLFSLGCVLSFGKYYLFSQLNLSLTLSCSLNKNAATFLFLASHQEPLGISTRVSFSLNKTVAASSSLALGISPRASWHLSPRFLQLLLPCSWHLTKSLLASHHDSLAFSTRLLPLTQEWVRPLALINLMREGEEISNLTTEIRLDGWLRFGVSSLTLTLIIKLSFNLHLTN